MRVLRRRDRGFPCCCWLGRDPSFPGGARRVDPRRRTPRLPLWGALLLPRPPHGGRARRPPPRLSLRPSFLPSVFATESRTPRPGPARLLLLSPSGASDRSEGNFRRPEGWRGGRPLWPFSARGVLSACGRRAARPRPGPAASRSPRRRGRPLSAPPVSLPKHVGRVPETSLPPGGRRRFKASSCLARRGRGRGSSASTPYVPPGGRGASRAEGSRAEPSARSFMR